MDLEVYSKTSKLINILSLVYFTGPWNLLLDIGTWQGIGWRDAHRKRLIPLPGLQAPASVTLSPSNRKIAAATLPLSTEVAFLHEQIKSRGRDK